MKADKALKKQNQRLTKLTIQRDMKQKKDELRHEKEREKEYWAA